MVNKRPEFSIKYREYRNTLNKIINTSFDTVLNYKKMWQTI